MPLTDTDKIHKLKEIIDDSENIVFFGGAGISTESGVPDFRSKDGLYNTPDVRFDMYPPEYFLSHECLVYNPVIFYEFYRQKMDSRKAHPNAAHKYLAELEKIGKLKAIVTQNIDGLHQDAGSTNVYEIHGTTRRNYCMNCYKSYPSDYIYDSKDPVPKCECGGKIRCDVTLYGESLPEIAVQNAINAISKADTLIIGGTSLTVYPAASYVQFFSGRHLVIINKTHLSLPADINVELEINMPIGEVFSQINL